MRKKSWLNVPVLKSFLEGALLLCVGEAKWSRCLGLCCCVQGRHWLSGKAGVVGAQWLYQVPGYNSPVCLSFQLPAGMQVMVQITELDWVIVAWPQPDPDAGTHTSG